MNIAPALVALLVQAPAAPAAAGLHWTADWGDDECTLTLADPQRPDATWLYIERWPGQDETVVSLANPGWSPTSDHPDRQAKLSLDPGGPVAATPHFARGLQKAPPSLEFHIRDHGAFLDRLAGATSLSAAVAKQPLGRFGLPAADKAVASLRSCEEDALRTWGVDPAFWASLRSPPVAHANLASYVRTSDYPESALRAHATGIVRVRLTVSTEGRATDCAIVRSSGNAALDALTCEILVNRARFTPAVGADGRPVAAPLVARMGWWTPSH